MLSAVTTTGAYSLSNTPSILSSASFSKSESCLPPALPTPHSNIAESLDKSDCGHPCEAIPFVNVHETVSPSLDFPAKAFRLSEYAVENEAASIDQAAAKLHVLEPPHLTERGGRSSNSTAPTAFYSLSNSLESPNSPSEVEKDEHEIYLDNLKLLNFGDTSEIGVGDKTYCHADEFLSEGFSFSVIRHDDDDATSWVEIGLQKYGWQI
jgi:hypothetical protein